jgi:hypothetical protein
MLWRRGTSWHRSDLSLRRYLLNSDGLTEGTQPVTEPVEAVSTRDTITHQVGPVALNPPRLSTVPWTARVPALPKSRQDGFLVMLLSFDQPASSQQRLLSTPSDHEERLLLLGVHGQTKLAVRGRSVDRRVETMHRHRNRHRYTQGTIKGADSPWRLLVGPVPVDLELALREISDARGGAKKGKAQ